MKNRVSAILLSALLGMPGLAKSLDYPRQPITLICPWAAGGSSDLSCRTIASLSRKYLGAPMNVVNRPGGNGAVALGELANNIRPDGYTISLFSNGGFITMPYIQDVTFNLDNLAFIIGTTSEPLAVIVRADSQLTSLKDVVNRYRRTKIPVTNGQSGINGVPYMFSVLMFRNMEVEQNVVPYPGASEALSAMLGGEVEMIIIHPGMVLSSLQSGEARLIAMIYNRRVPTFPDCPTVEEQGFGQVHAETYKGLVAPAATDPAIIEWLADGMRKIEKDPVWLDFLKNNGIEPTLFDNGTAIKKALQGDVTRLWPVMEELKLLKPGAAKPNF